MFKISVKKITHYVLIKINISSVTIDGITST